MLAGANLRVQDKEGMALRLAQLELIALSGIGNTPLHIAVCSQAADAEALVMLLLRGSVDVNARNNLSVSPVDLASTDKVHFRFTLMSCSDRNSKLTCVYSCFL